MPTRKIAWENWKEKVDYSPPEINNPEEILEEDEEGLEKSILAAMEIPRLVQTPLGIFQYEDKLRPSEKFDCWIGYTNFDITQNISDLIESIAGVEALEIMSRYTFFLGVGKMFKFRDVRTSIEELLLDKDIILANDDIMKSVEIIKQRLSSEKHWAIFVSDDGDIDYAKTDNKNDEQFMKSLSFFEEAKNSIGGFILKSGD